MPPRDFAPCGGNKSYLQYFLSSVPTSLVLVVPCEFSWFSAGSRGSLPVLMVLWFSWFSAGSCDSLGL